MELLVDLFANNNCLHGYGIHNPFDPYLLVIGK